MPVHATRSLPPQVQGPDFGPPGLPQPASPATQLLAQPGAMNKRRAGRSVAWAVIGVALLLGCSRGRPGIEIVKVEGRVTLDGGPMPAAGRLLFLPQAVAGSGDEARPSRPASATFAADGRFQATSWEPGDGLVPGKYAVVVECWQTPPTMNGPPAVSHVPAAYRAAETTPLTLEVPGGQQIVRAELDVGPAGPSGQR